MFRIIFLMVLTQVLLLSAGQTKQLLILHSYNQSYSWTENLQKGINSVLNPTEYEVHIEYMDTKRYGNKKHYKNLVTLYKNKYKNTKFDAIIVSDDNAFNFLKFNRKSLFKDVPVVFCGINYLKKSDTEGLSNITGISEEADILKNFQLIKKLHPQNRDVYVVIDVTTTGNRVKNEVDKVLETMPKDEVNYHILQGLTIDEVQSHLKDKKGVVLLTVFFNDSFLNTYEYYELIKKLDANVNLPLYGLWDMNFGNGLVGGYLTSGFFQGQEAAKIAKSVFDGVDINTIDIKYKSPNKYMFDYKVMQKYDIEIGDLPKEHVLINYKKPFYKRYMLEISLVIIFMIFTWIIIIDLLINIKRRKKAEKSLLQTEKNLEKKVKQRTSELAENIKNLEHTREQLVHSEKMSALGGLVAGVAHEINTPIGLGLTGMTHFDEETKNVMKLYESNNLSQDEFEKFIKTSGELSKVILSNLRKSAELVQSFKQISVDQSSEIKREFNLDEYTHEVFLSLTSAIKKHDVSFIIQSDNININSYPGPYAQIITNLVMNSLIHAYKKGDKGTISIEARIKGSKIYITYSDDGAGIEKENLSKIFDPFFTTNRKNGGTGLGLNIIYNIIKTTFKGEITCDSTLGEGTQFYIELYI